MAGGNELEPNDSRNVTGTARTPDGRWSGDKPAPGRGGELEPADSRNVTGTASTPDGRWTNDQGTDTGNPDASPSGTNPQAEDSQGIPQTGEEDPLAEVSTETDYADNVADFSRSEGRQGATNKQPEGGDDDSIEPSRIPGTAEDIKVAGETGPGPSG
ncbi:MAG: hypothetical protein ABW023_11080 [Sphingomonas sp.]